jgi:hypothetical protein
MRHGKYSTYLAALMLAIAASSATHAATPAADPVATSKALNALLAASNNAIPESSTCYGSYGQEGAATVKDLVAMQLAYLYSGKNTIKGHCTATQCTLSIAHAAGDDVSSAVIKFKLVRGKANAATLRCVITP